MPAIDSYHFDARRTSAESLEDGYKDLLEDGDAWLPTGPLRPDEAQFYVEHQAPWDNVAELD